MNCSNIWHHRNKETAKNILLGDIVAGIHIIQFLCKDRKVCVTLDCVTETGVKYETSNSFSDMQKKDHTAL